MSAQAVAKKTKSKRVPLKTIQAEFNRLIASGKPCAKCGQTFPVMQCSHILSVGSYPNLRFDPMNTLPMCGHCHMFWWHLEPSESWEWFKEKYPGRNEYLQIAKNKLVKRTSEDLLEIRRKIKVQDLRGLIIAPELVI